MNFVIIGNSAAGLNAVLTILKTDKIEQPHITVISEEEGPAYSRVLTSYFIAGVIDEKEMMLADSKFYRENRITTFFSCRALKVHPGEKKVILTDGQEVKYDRLLIATGARPYLPDIEGIKKKGVFTLRTRQDAREILDRVADVSAAVILGGGPVSLKAAQALQKHGIKITLIIGSDRVLSQLLDKKSSLLVSKYLEKKGFNIMTETGVEEIKGKKKVREVILTSGKSIPADLVVVGKGIRPNKRLVEETDIRLDQGIIVNDFMQTSLEDIYAAGDVAQAWSIVREKKVLQGIWPAAVAQGRIAGYNMSGIKRRYAGSLRNNVIDIDGLYIAAAGITQAPGNYQNGLWEEVVVEGKDYYKKLIIRDKLIVGCIFQGDIKNGGMIQSLIRKKISIDRLPNLVKLLKTYDYLRLVKGLSRIKQMR